MQDQSQSCPSCRSNKYNNPQLKLMVNTCGHSLCENCVEVLFARGSGLCVQCKTPIRKVNFRYQLFEDPLVQKEVELRKKILSDFNKREDDFDSLEEYDLYLEKIEDIIYNLMNDVDVDETKRFIENYKKENKDIIKRNRLRPSASMAFYDSELEREAMLREQREREEQARRENLIKGPNANYPLTETSNLPTTESYPTPTSALPNAGRGRDLPIPLSAIKRPPPPSSSHPIPASEFGRPRLATPTSQLAFASPISAMPGRAEFDRGGFISPAPPSAFSGTMLAPVSAMPGLGTPTAWNLSAHHTVHLPPPRSAQTRQPDSILIPNRGQLARTVSATSQGATSSGINTSATPFKYEPYQLDMCGPPPVEEHNPRWPNLIGLYEDCIIRPLRGDEDWKPNGSLEQPPDSRWDSLSTGSPLPVKVKADPDLNSFPSKRDEDEVDSGIKQENDASNLGPLKQEEPAMLDKKPLLGISHQLPQGACGIAPQVFLERCLQESRCGLFL